MRGRTLLVLLVLLSAAAHAQGLVEVRYADTSYRFADVSYVWKNGVTLDTFYVGVPGSNELNLGGGYAVKRGALTLTPLAYAVIGKEDDQRGVKTALLAAYERNDWKLLAFGGAYFKIDGLVGDYQVLDTADFTRVVAKRWELGVQSGFFHIDGSWNTQVGPVVKLNDSKGAWAVSYRWGNEDEFRVGRVFFFQ